MGCHRERHQRTVARSAFLAPAERLSQDGGQGTVEYAVVLFALMSVVAALAALSNALSNGLFVEHALIAASHHVQLSALGSVADVFAY